MLSVPELAKGGGDYSNNSGDGGHGGKAEQSRLNGDGGGNGGGAGRKGAVTCIPSRISLAAPCNPPLTRISIGIATTCRTRCLTEDASCSALSVLEDAPRRCNRHTPSLAHPHSPSA